MICKKQYLTLFNAITDALRELEQGRFDGAKWVLMCAQQKTEQLYIESGE